MQQKPGSVRSHQCSHRCVYTSLVSSPFFPRLPPSPQRVVPDFVAQTGDPYGDGRGGESIYGPYFDDEISAKLSHDRKGTVSMANASSRNTNSSQFFLTFKECPHLDGKHTVFGYVTEDCWPVLDDIQRVKCKNKKPVDPGVKMSVERDGRLRLQRLRLFFFWSADSCLSAVPDRLGSRWLWSFLLLSLAHTVSPLRCSRIPGRTSPCRRTPPSRRSRSFRRRRSAPSNSRRPTPPEATTASSLLCPPPSDFTFRCLLLSLAPVSRQQFPMAVARAATALPLFEHVVLSSDAFHTFLRIVDSTEHRT